jgi:hypothetical protein
METKTLYSLLKEKDYQVRGDAERRKLQDACNEYMHQGNQALWYSDLSKGISEYIRELYLADKIPKSPETRRRHLNHIDWDVKRYFEENPEATISKEEFRNNLENYDMDKFCINTALSELETSQKGNSALFGIKDIYQTIREHYKLSQKDKLEINSPIYLINKDNFEEIRQKGIALNDKRMGKTARNDSRAMLRIKYEYMDPFSSAILPIYNSFTPEKQEEFEEGNPKWNFDINPINNLAREYLSIASKLPIAYTDTKNAIDFFETDTGILMSKPKEYKKMVFGR